MLFHIAPNNQLKYHEIEKSTIVALLPTGLGLLIDLAEFLKDMFDYSTAMGIEPKFAD